MNTFSTNERALSITDQALFLTVTKSAGEVGAMAHGGLIGLLIALLIRKVAESKDKGLQPDPGINFENQTALVNCRVIDLPATVRADPQWPKKVRDGAKVQVIPKSSISEIKLSGWTGMNGADAPRREDQISHRILARRQTAQGVGRAGLSPESRLKHYAPSWNKRSRNCSPQRDSYAKHWYIA